MKPVLGGAAKFILPAVAVIGGVGMIQLYGQLQAANGQLRRNQQDIARLTSENDTLNQQVVQQRSKFDADRRELEGRAASLRTQLASVTGDLEQARAGAKEAEDRYAQASRELDRANASLDGVTAERDEARARATKLEETNVEL